MYAEKEFRAKGIGMSAHKQIDLVEGVSQYFKPTALVAKIRAAIIRSHKIQRAIINAIALSQTPFICGFALLKLTLTTVSVSVTKNSHLLLEMFPH
jgi:chaperone required for assembly of F1-ATPase